MKPHINHWIAIGKDENLMELNLGNMEDVVILPNLAFGLQPLSYWQCEDGHYHVAIGCHDIHEVIFQVLLY